MSACVLQLLLIWISNITDSTCRKLREKLRRPALQANILHPGKKSTLLATPNTLQIDGFKHSVFAENTQSFLNSMTRAPKSLEYNITLQK